MPTLHPTAIVESPYIGHGSQISAFTHILERARVGNECQISDRVFIENDVVIGNRVAIRGGAYIGDGALIEDEVTIGPKAVVAARVPIGTADDTPLVQTAIGRGASLGAGSTFVSGITIGANAVVHAGAVVTNHVPRNAVVEGDPANIVGYRNSSRNSLTSFVTQFNRTGTEIMPSRVSGVSVRILPTVPDLRGSLTFGEFQRHIPFSARRFFFIYDVPSKELRGEHAHRQNEVFLICMTGEVRVLVDNGSEREEFVLDAPDIGIHIPPLVWASQYRYSPGSVLLCFASQQYDPSDYIRDYDAFLSEVSTDSR